MTTSRKEFITEAEELLADAQRLTIELQDSVDRGDVNPEDVNALFRDMHTLKGLSGLFGLQWITELSHRLESLLDDLRLGKIEPTASVAEFLLQNIDLLRSLVKDSEDNKGHDVSESLEAIDRFKEQASRKDENVPLKGLVDGSILSVLSEYEEHRLRSTIKEGRGVYSLRAIFALGDFDARLAELTQRIKQCGEVISTLPTSDGVPAGSIGFQIIFGSVREREALAEGLSHDLETLIPKRQERKSDDAGSSLRSISSTVRVDIEKLDRILNSIGEISLAKGAIKRISDEFFEKYGFTPLAMDIYKVGRALERRVSELQDQVLDIRMIPIGQIFSRLAQVVRRYSRQMDKRINLHMFGEDTNIDKYLAEEVVDPLMHIVRNSIDHGIEREQERIAAAKSPDGSITLKAFQRGNHVVIEVSDDGRGIDVGWIRKKALEKGHLEQGRDYSDAEIMDFLYLPGFSTASEVTEVSGRGVGLDVVKEKLSKLGGFVSLHSSFGEGTTLSLTLPITLAILRALMVRVGQERFAIPLTSIVEALTVDPGGMQKIEGKMVVNLRGEMIPVVRTGDLLGISHSDDGTRYVIIIGFGERRMGLMIDEMFGQHEIVIKSLGGYFEGHKVFAGASEVGRHEIVLVMDMESIIESALLRHREKTYV